MAAVEVTFGATIADLAPVIVGGVLTAFGAFTVAFVSHKLGRKTEKEKLKREKLEALVTLAHQTLHWYESYRNHYLFDAEVLSSQSPVDGLAMMSDLYFPELKTHVARVAGASANYVQWVVKSKVRSLNRSLPGNDLITDDFGPVFEELHSSVSDLSVKAGEIMRELNGFTRIDPL